MRGVVSNGMLCSASELETAAESDGIIELDEEPLGGHAGGHGVGAWKTVIDFEVTPNRPDWLGVVGIARDLAAAGLGQAEGPDCFADSRQRPGPWRSASTARAALCSPAG